MTGDQALRELALMSAALDDRRSRVTRAYSRLQLLAMAPYWLLFVWSMVLIAATANLLWVLLMVPAVALPFIVRPLGFRFIERKYHLRRD